jgi:hypothetical protein
MRLLGLVVIVAAAACATTPQAVRPPSAPPRPACVMPDGDRAWIDRALEAWRFTSREITVLLLNSYTVMRRDSLEK